MVVYYVVSSPQIAQEPEQFLSINKLILKLGHELANEHSAQTYYEMANKIADQEDYEIICRASLQCVRDSNVCIVDATNKSTFGVGYLTSQALELGKPVLLLLHEKSLGGSFIAGLKHPLITRQYYNDKTLEHIVAHYLQNMEAK